MGIEQTLLQEIKESKRWLNLEKDESTYKRDLAKRIELINWVLENMKNPSIKICDLSSDEDICCYECTSFLSLC